MDNLEYDTLKFTRLKDTVKVVAFDADDTLWENEHYFRQTESAFCELLSAFMTPIEIQHELYKTEVVNLTKYGYGIKGYILSMIETAIRVSDGAVCTEVISAITDLGKQMLDEPVVLIDGIREVLQELSEKYKLIVATKGDLLDQERKLAKSGLLPFFHHIEVMTEKNEENYLKLVKHLDIKPSELFMVGNSLKSDVIPIINIGGFAAHIPFYVTCIHEQVKENVDSPRFRQLIKIREITEFL